MTRVFFRALSGLLLATATVVGSGTAAHAAPQGCSTSQTLQSASSICTSGTGEHRVAVWALNQITGATGGQTFFGPWVPAGVTSSVTVPGPFVIPGWSPAGVQTRG